MYTWIYVARRLSLDLLANGRAEGSPSAVVVAELWLWSSFREKSQFPKGSSVCSTTARLWSSGTPNAEPM